MQVRFSLFFAVVVNNSYFREILGEEARVAEILSEEDQATVVSVMKEAESMFISQIVSYWWSGLNDVDDDGVWEWVESEQI